MAKAQASRLLTINTGSSSLKAALYDVAVAPRLVLAAKVERIGLGDGHACLTTAQGEMLFDEHKNVPDHRAGLLFLLDGLRHTEYHESPRAVGHRVVHGGRRHSEPHIITDELLEELRLLIPIDPAHLPQAIEAIETVGDSYPTVPQVACFDTAFHRRMPRVAQIYPLPQRFEEAGVLRYGFHGLSYESIMEQLRCLDPAAYAGRVVIAHLGNGASMAAVKGGKSVDTTMGFTPTGGLMMGTRAGDLDPGVVLHLLDLEGGNAGALSDLLNKKAGLIGLSGLSADMQDLLEQESSSSQAADAVDLFCYQARKFLGALVTTLGGLDVLAFTAGIGEHAAPIRERICDGLNYLGIQLDPQRNQNNSRSISADGSSVRVLVLPTDEDLMIAGHTQRLIAEAGGLHVPV
jgi:acetate kinase